MTNLEKIRQMSDYELARLIVLDFTEGTECPARLRNIPSCPGTTDCVECWRLWLNEEAADD